MDGFDPSGAVDAQFGAGADDVVREIARRRATTLKSCDGDVLEVESEHQERRTVWSWRARSRRRPLSPVSLSDHPPGDRLVAVEAGERAEVALQQIDIQRRRRRSGFSSVREAVLVAAGETLELRERGIGSVVARRRLTGGFPPRVFGFADRERQEACRFIDSAAL